MLILLLLFDNDDRFRRLHDERNSSDEVIEDFFDFLDRFDELSRRRSDSLLNPLPIISISIFIALFFFFLEFMFYSFYMISTSLSLV